MRRVSSARWKTRADLLMVVENLRAMLMSQPERRWTLKQLASIGGLSPYHLQRIFASTYGASPTQFHRQFRLETAKALLGTGHSATEVCERLGFVSRSSFARDFRRAFGLSPSEAQHR